MQLFLVYYGLPIIIGYSIPAFSTALVGLTLYATAYLGEIVKAGLQSVDIYCFSPNIAPRRSQCGRFFYSAY
jgi:ABC-type amino acid transport system permease subunit